MSLDNLVRTGQLKPQPPDPVQIARLLAAAGRNLEDARIETLSDESRFDCAYKVIMQCALAALRASGYRPSSNAPGHHQTMISSLTLTLELPAAEWRVLDALRKKRNVSDYLGGPIDPESMRECVARAGELLARTKAWLADRHPELLRDP